MLALQCFVKDVDQDMVVLLAARASRTENMDAIDTCIIGCLADPKEVSAVPLSAPHCPSACFPIALPGASGGANEIRASSSGPCKASLPFPWSPLKAACCCFSMSLLWQARAGITEVHFFPFNPVDKRTAITYIDDATGKMYRASKGLPSTVLSTLYQPGPALPPSPMSGFGNVSSSSSSQARLARIHIGEYAERRVLRTGYSWMGDGCKDEVCVCPGLLCPLTGLCRSWTCL